MVVSCMVVPSLGVMVAEEVLVEVEDMVVRVTMV